MGIYISDLEIPKDKAVQIVIIRDDGVCVDEWGNTYGVVSLPLHGDLIDRNALVRKFEEIEESIGYAEVPLALAVAGAINDIKKTPTVIEAEPRNDLAKPNDTIFAVQNTDEDEWLFAAKPIDYMHHPSVEEIIEGNGFDSFIKHFED